MEEKEVLLTNNETENVETQPTEEIVEGIDLTDTVEETEQVEEQKKEEVRKTLKELLKENPEYQEEFNTTLETRLNRERKIAEREKEKELSKYKNTEAVLNAGLGTKNIDEADQKLRNFYKEQGVNIPDASKPGLSDRELEILAKAEAEEIIELGVEEATKEANQLASKGYTNLNTKEKAVFNTLANYLTTETDKTELKKLGVSADILDDKDFKNFRNEFSPKTSIVRIHELYSKTKGEKETPKPIGSMITAEPNKEKDYYTPEEARHLTMEDYNKNPKLEEIIVKSAKLWQEKGIV